METTRKASSGGSRTPSAESWLRVDCAAAAEDAAAEILRELGAGAVAVAGDAWEVPGPDVIVQDGGAGRPARLAVLAVFPADFAARARAQLQEMLRQRIVPHFGPADASVVPVPSVDWAARYAEGVRATEVSPGFFVAPPWDRPPRGRVLLVEPGAAFGAGDHPTTRTCLRLLFRLLPAGADVMDLGCGTGVLGAAALLQGAARLRAYDIDPLAVRAARRTFALNGLSAPVRLGSLPRRARPADLLLGNLSASALRPLLADLRRALRPGGILIAGGILAGDERFAGELEAADLCPIDRETEGDWQAVAAQRRGEG